MHTAYRVVIVLCVLCLCALLAGPAGVSFGQVFTPDAVVAGKPIAEWVPDFWRLQFINDMAATVDPTFDYFNTNNNGPVFLSISPDSLSPDSPAEIIETRFVPADRPVLSRATVFSALLLPEEVDPDGVPVWFSQNPVDGVRVADLDWAQQWAGQELESISGFTVQVSDSSGAVFFDSETAADYRVAATIPLSVPSDNPFGLPEGEWPLVTDGYYLMLEPIAMGEQATLTRTFTAPWGTDFRITSHFHAVPEPSTALSATVLLVCVALSRRLVLKGNG